MFWDVGGKMRPLWERYYNECHAVIFVVDSMQCRYMCGEVDKDRKSKANLDKFRELFDSVWKDKRLRQRNVPFLVYASKRDFECEPSNVDHYDEDCNPPHQEESYDLLLDMIDLEKIFLTTACVTTDINAINDRDRGRIDHIKVFGGSAKTGEGINEALLWLVEVLRERFIQSRNHSL